MDKELQDYYEARLQMFVTKGWTDLIQDFRQMKAATDTLNGVTPENLGFKQGELSIMDWMLNLESLTREAYADLSVPVPEGTQD